MIWKRYLIKEILKVFFLFLFSFYFLYAMIDYSMHLQQIMKSTKIGMGDLSLYYTMLLSKRSDLLLPLALLIALLKVICTLNRKNELLAFQAGGISIKKLLSPFLILGFFCLAVNYLNLEFLAPRSLNYIDQFEKKYFRKKKPEKQKGEAVHVLPLEDGSHLIYQGYDQEKKELFDVFWVITPDNLWHMKTLSLKNSIPVGNKVDALRRTEKGLMEKGDAHETHLFHDLKLDFDLKTYIGKPMENRSISELAQLMKSPQAFLKEKKNLIRSQFYFKMLMPWLSLFVVIGVAPYVTTFSRHLSVFLIFSLGIFGYIALFMIISASVILGESQVISPFWALFTIPMVTFFFFGRKYLKMG